jgi:hypothetical protein
MFHGFTGNKIETNRLFIHIANHLKENQISSIRFDWFGHGESEMDLGNLTIDSLLEQAHYMLQYATKKYRSVSLLGFSMGGAIAINSLSFNPKKLILISPATNMDKIAKSAFENSNKIDDNLADIRGFKLSRTFVDSLRNLEYNQNISSYNGKTLLINGTKDQVCPIENTKSLAEQAKKAKLVEIVNADHGYGGLDFIKQVCIAIIDFIKE